jgi:filamentous hemagglutinin
LIGAAGVLGPLALFALPEAAGASYTPIVLEGGAAESGPLSGASFAQKTFSQTFSADGAFAGRTIDDVAGALNRGEMSAADVPVQYIVRDGNTLILNTRSAQALEQAGIPRSQWNAIDMTGDAAAEARLTGQLQRNGLTSQGTTTVRPTKPGGGF